MAFFNRCLVTIAVLSAVTHQAVAFESGTDSLSPAGPILTERSVPLGGAAPDRLVLKGTLIASPDAAHVVYKHRWGNLLQYVGYSLDDQTPLGVADMTAPTFAPDSQSVAVVIRENGWGLHHEDKLIPGFEPVRAVRFSPDGQRLVYLAQLDGRRFVVEGKQPQPMADRILFDQLVFSPDSSRLAYPAYDGRAWRMVINGDPGSRWESLTTAPIVAKSGSRVFFVARKNGRAHVIEGDISGPTFRFIGDNLALSDDGSRFAYWALTDENRWAVYLNHRHLRAYDADRPGQLIISPDGQTLAAVLKRNGKWFVVRDGVPGPACDAIGQGSLTLSPDDSRLAYAVRKPTGWAVVVDEQEGQTFTQLLSDSLRFSPDSNRLAYGALSRGRWSLIVDGVPQQPFNKIDARTIRFSPDSQHLAYVGYRLGRPVVMRNDQSQGEYDLAALLTFSPDSTHLVFVAQQDGLAFLVADGVQSQESFTHLVPGANIRFASDTACHTVAVRSPGPHFYRIELELAPAPAPAPGYAPGYAPGDTPGYAPGYAPTPAPPEPMSPFVDVPTP